jgi:acyl carrier protein
LIGSLVTLRPREREEALQRHLRRKIATLVGRPADREIDEHIGFRELGLDSLLAIELRNGIQTDLGVVLPATLAFDFPTLAALSAFLLSTLGPLDHEPSPTAAVERPAGNNGDQAGACVPDEEALRLLERELTSLEQEMGRRTP